MSEKELENAFINGFSTKNSSGVGLNFVKTVMEEHKSKIFIKNRKKEVLEYISLCRGRF